MVHFHTVHLPLAALLSACTMWRTGDAFATLLIPTIDSARCEFTLELSLSQRRPVLLIGGPGTAKTSTVLQVLAKQSVLPNPSPSPSPNCGAHPLPPQVLAKQNPASIVTKTLSFSSATSPSIFQATVEV